MASVFGGHDRSRLEVFCYALSPSGRHLSQVAAMLAVANLKGFRKQLLQHIAA